MKIGVNLKINVSKIEKGRLFNGSKGKYLDCVVFIDIDNKGEYGDNGMVTQQITKEERERNIKGQILGNATVFWTDNSRGQQTQQQQAQQAPPQYQQQQNPQQQVQQNQAPAQKFDDSFDDDIPF